MTENPHLFPILDDYIRENAPGYSVMVTAPWGAGKTFVLSQWLSGKPHLKVSLFGLTSLLEIEERVLNAELSRRDFKVPKGVTKALEGITKKVIGAEIDLTGFYRQQILSSLPNLIVFDDLERARMPAPLLLSLLNRFVEHDQKSVILIANEAELDRNHENEVREYRRWREKVIGRTVTLNPETDLALPLFLEALPRSEGRRILTEHKDLVRKVFHHSGTKNLRLLRQSCAELARFLDRLPEHYQTQPLALPGLVGDFVALSLDWHQGNLKVEDFELERRPWQRVARRMNKDDSPLDRVEVLGGVYKDVPEVSLDGMHLPGELAYQCIALGHANDKAVQRLMKQAVSFDQPTPEAWLTLWYWSRVKEEEVVRAHESIKVELRCERIVEPEIILHVHGTLLEFAEEGLFNYTKEAVVAQAERYVEALASSGKLRSPSEENDWDFRSLREASRGFAYRKRETDEFKQIVARMLSAFEQLRSASRPERLSQLLMDLADDPRRFSVALRGGDKLLGIPNLFEELLFIDADAEQAAEQVFALPPDRWHTFLLPFKERIERQEYLASKRNDGRPTEKEWLEHFRRSALSLASAASPLRRSQMHIALTSLGFLDAQPSDGPVAE